MGRMIYVAGALSAEHPLGYLENVAEFERDTVFFESQGFAVFSPAEDFLRMIARKLLNQETDMKKIYGNSMVFLERSDAVSVIPGWENSKGTIAEIRRAEELKIPVFYDKDDCVEYLRSLDDKANNSD